jgi:hypothetical protein
MVASSSMRASWSAIRSVVNDDTLVSTGRRTLTSLLIRSTE